MKFNFKYHHTRFDVQDATETVRYLKSCASDFWQQVFAAELDYLLQHLKPEDEILSVGCGPAMLERMLLAVEFRRHQ